MLCVPQMFNKKLLENQITTNFIYLALLAHFLKLVLWKKLRKCWNDPLRRVDQAPLPTQCCSILEE